MAVYKATYCYPFLNSIDPRVTEGDTIEAPRQYLKCKVDTSNKNVTGYKITILDHDNNIIFDGAQISPILELPQGLGDGINTGVNGTYLYIPFFQTYKKILLKSYNALYYNGRFKAQYIIQSGATDSPEYAGGWTHYNATAATKEMLQRAGWDGTLNGELVFEGDIILCLDTGTKGGLWKVLTSGVLERVESAEGTTLDVDGLANASAGGPVVITQGIYHNSIYISNGAGNAFTEGTNTWYIYTSSTSDPGGTLSSFDINDGSYKWVITLYQSAGLTGYTAAAGMPSEGMLHGGSGVPYYVDYSTLGMDWYDMVLNSGEILGSTPNRIQVASSTSDDAILPGEEQSTPLVLQGYYIQLLSATHAQLGSRAYIETYDSNFGHVYPVAGSFTNDLLEPNGAAVYCCFYKHTNDPNSVLATDGKVKVATTASISGTSTSSTSVIDGYTLQAGDLVLVKDGVSGDYTKNGVYLIPSSGTWSRAASFDTWGEFIGKYIYVETGSTNAGKNFQSLAAAGGTLWVNSSSSGASELFFIEEEPITIFANKITGTATVITSSNPSSSDLKIDSYTLKVGDIVLYRNSTWYTKQVTAVSSSSVTYGAATAVTAGTNWRILQGYTYGGSVRSVSTSSPYISKAASTYEATILKNTQANTYIRPFTNLSKLMRLKFLNGKTVIDNLGNTTNYLQISAINTKIWKVTHTTLSTPIPSYSESDKTIPYKYEIRSFFQESDENPFNLYEMPYVKLGTPDEGTSSIVKYSQFQVLIDEDGVDYEDFTVIRDLYCGDKTYKAASESAWSTYFTNTIKNDEINYPTGLVFLCLIQDETCLKYYQVIQGESDRDYEEITNRVYKKDLVNETPEWQDELLPDISTSQVYVADIAENKIYQTAVGGGDWSLVASSESQRDSLPSLDFYVEDAALTMGTAQRFINLKGFYNSFQQASWESYRWVLRNAEGEILQDTGNKYDKRIEVTFYGLSNDSAGYKNIYYITLYVHDDRNNTFETTMKLIVSGSSVDSVDIPFTATYDCNTRSVLLAYQDNSYVRPSITLGNIDMVYDRSLPDIYWDDSLYYGREEGTKIYLANLSQPNHKTEIPIYDYREGKSNLSYTSLRGVKYEHFFTLEGKEIGSNLAYLSIENKDEAMEGQGTYTFLTEFKLHNNFAGEILSTQVQSDDDITKLTFKFVIPDMIDDENNLNSDRNKIEWYIIKDAFSILTTKNGFLETESNAAYTTYDPTGSQKYYYLENTNNSVSGKVEYVHYSSFTKNDTTYYPYYEVLYNSDGTVKNAVNYVKFLGNCGLVCDDEIYPTGNHLTTSEGVNTSWYSSGYSYWVENRAKLAMYFDSSKLINVPYYTSQVLSAINVFTVPPGAPQYQDDSVEEAMISWPDTEDETDYYWNESADLSYYSSSPSWGDSAKQQLTIMRAHSRREGTEFGDSFYRFYIKVKNVNGTGSGVETILSNLGTWDPTAEGAVTGSYDPISKYHITKISMGGTYPNIIEFGIKKITRTT